MDTLQVTPNEGKLEEFELEPARPTAQSLEIAARLNDVFARGEFVRMMIEAVDSEAGQAIGFASGGAARGGFQFRFYADEETAGWLSTLGDKESYTLINVRLDIDPAGR